MSAVAESIDCKRDLGLVAWQIRYEQRAYWRNRGRGMFTFVFPLMFLVIFGQPRQGRPHLAACGGIPYDDFFVPGILAYGVIATTFVNMAISTAILRDEGVLKRMQGTPLPRWAYVAARIGSTAGDRAGHDGRWCWRSGIAYGVHIRAVDAPGPDRHAAARHRGVHLARDRDDPVHPQRRGGAGGRQPADPAADVHLQHLVPDQPGCPRRWSTSPSCSRSGRWPTACSTRSIRARRAPASTVQDVRTLAIWTAVGVYLMIRFLRQPQGEVRMSRGLDTTAAGRMSRPARPACRAVADRQPVLPPRARRVRAGAGADLAGLHRLPADQRDRQARARAATRLDHPRRGGCSSPPTSAWS